MADHKPIIGNDFTYIDFVNLDAKTAETGYKPNDIWWTINIDNILGATRHMSMDSHYKGLVYTYDVEKEDIGYDKDMYSRLPCKGTICIRGKHEKYISYTTPTYCAWSNFEKADDAVTYLKSAELHSISELPENIDIEIPDLNITLFCECEKLLDLVFRDDLTGETYQYAPKYIVTRRGGKTPKHDGCSVCGMIAKSHCAICKTPYCGAKCQKKDWIWHKYDCYKN
jgi:hypothetical protein